MPAGSEPKDLDSSENKSTWGGSRPGSGRPQGSMNEATKERMHVKAAFIKRINNAADRLFNAQYNLAVGEQYLMHKYTVGTGTKARTVVDVVEDPEIIKEYLDDTLEQGDDEYYYISTKPANGMAIDSLLNRSFGKADENLDITSNGETLGVGLSAEQAEQLIRARARRSDT